MYLILGSEYFDQQKFLSFTTSKMSSSTYASSLELQERSPPTPPQLPPASAQPVGALHPSQNRDSHDLRVVHVEQHLEPADRGTAAWRLLGAMFIFEALFWGKNFPHQTNYLVI